ncbi:transient receptor potential cation channel subfamily V member 1-like [Glandiceps talaboti]
MNGKLVFDIYEGAEYHGESCIHIAIVNNDLEAVKLLVGTYGAKIDARATGKFFLPEDKKDSKSGYTNYFGYAYYGEYPLTFAACMQNKEIYDYLIHMSIHDSSRLGVVDPNAKDALGNTILHHMVIHNLPDMYGYVLKHQKMPADPEIVNNVNMTPLALACKLGRSEMFRAMMELSCIEFWRYGSVQCNAYPLQAVDSIGRNGEINWSGALMMIVNGSTDEHLEMLNSGVIFRLLEEKWSVFAKRQLTWRCVMAVLQIIILSICVYTRPSGDLLGGTDAVSIVDVPAKVVYLISCVLIFLCLPMRIAGLSNVEDKLFILAVPASWTYLLFFYRGIKSTKMGPLITMIYKMITGDLLRSGIIYSVFLFTFSPVMYYLYEDSLDPHFSDEEPTFDTAHGTYMALFMMTFGEYPYDELDHARISALAKLIFVAFSLLIPILLLNMLIAMMSNTFQSIQEKSKKQWLRQWAKIILVIERALSKSDMLKQQSQYADVIPLKKTRHRPFGTSFGTSEKGGRTGQTLEDNQVDDKGPGLVIVKLRERSKAMARREAQAKWKLVGSNARSKLIKQRVAGESGESQAEEQQRRVLSAFSFMKAKTKLKHSGSVGPADI